MDLLVKQNVIKKQKIIIDIGCKYIKILGVNYEKGKITINSSTKIDATQFFFEGELSNIKDFVRSVYGTLNRRKMLKNSEISLSIPSYMVTHKIVRIKNVNLKDLDKYIKKECMAWNKVNMLTHNIDWSYLGSREVNGETIRYCMVAAINKAYITPIMIEFEKKSLIITTVSFGIYNLVSFANLYSNDYENLNKVLIDFGAQSTKLVVECEGVAIYSREISIGFNTFVDELFRRFSSIGIPEIIDMLTQMERKRENFLAGIHDKTAFFEVVDNLIESFQNEIIRTIQMCEEDGISISKIVCCSSILDGMLDAFVENGITVDNFDISELKTVNGSNYLLTLGDAELDATFNSAIGLSVSTLL